MNSPLFQGILPERTTTMKATMFYIKMDSWLRLECICRATYVQRITTEIDFVYPARCPDCNRAYHLEIDLKTTTLSKDYTGQTLPLEDHADELPEGHRYYRNPSNTGSLKT